jgi:cellulose synthase/poly-beta-1,6-N-acetylglucosamine synthase-like glycosyltransferase
LILIDLGYWLLTLYLMPFFAFLALVSIAALTRARRRPRTTTAIPTAGPTRFLIVIPAHNEEANIESTIASCRSIDYDPASFTVFVIADNCTDETARIAREAGANVVERRNDQLRSKGHALDDFFQLQRVSEVRADGTREYDAVVVVDADTVVDRDLLTRFSETLAQGADWAQCYYTVRNADASWRTRLLTYAFSLFNGVWLLGQDRLGLSVGYRGNGMCFSTQGLGRCPWKAHGLVEDHEFSWMLRLAGERVRFVPETRVYAEMVTGGKASVSQRNRWEQGRRSLPASFLKPLLAARSIGLFRKAMFLIDLRFPSLMVLFALLFGALTIHPAAVVATSLQPLSRQLFPLHGLMLLTTAVYALSPCLVMNLPARYLGSLMAVPYYVSWKFLMTSRKRTAAWVRTERKRTTSSGPA